MDRRGAFHRQRCALAIAFATFDRHIHHNTSIFKLERERGNTIARGQNKIQPKGKQYRI